MVVLSAGALNKFYYDDSEGYNDLKRNDIECKFNDIVMKAFTG